MGFEPFFRKIPEYAWFPNQSWLHWMKQPANPCSGLSWYLVWIEGDLFENALTLTKGLVFLLLLCPRSESWLSIWGRRSLYCLLIHQPLMELQLTWFADKAAGDWLIPLPSQDWYVVLLAWMLQLVWCTTLTILCSSLLAEKVFGFIVEPNWAPTLLERLGHLE